MAVAPGGNASERTTPLKRIRWATQRHNAQTGSLKRRSIFARHMSRRSADEKKRQSDGSDSADPKDEMYAAAAAKANPPGSVPEGNGQVRPRTVYFNQPLPSSERDADGKPLHHFARNKIRTAKYTPLSFIPKNLWFQFHNIANVYFLIVIILGIFSIFGVTNPGLAAVPLIVIIIITAIKDAIEDWRRTVLDNELNNAPVHRLVDWENVNTSEENVSLWRRFKKANTRAVVTTWHFLNSHTKKGKAAAAARKEREREAELGDSAERRISTVSAQYGTVNGDVELTPVPSPTPGNREQAYDEDGRAIYAMENREVEPGNAVQTLAVPERTDGEQAVNQPLKRSYGSLVNPMLEVPETARFKRDYWKSVQVGDFVRLYNNEEIPADIVVISTSDSDGACYVETKNLDGETNLKVRNALHSGQMIRRARDCERAQFVLESEPPHPNLYAYSGAVRWKQHDPKNPDAPPRDMAEPVAINNLLLRGCSLRNTDWIIGVVVFTGDDTKIMQNSGITPSKRAQVAKDLNINVLINFGILFCMCLICGVVDGIDWGQSNQTFSFFEYGSFGNSPAVNGIITFFAAVILFQNLVPISLYISLEIIRTAQAFFIYSDTYMYYEKLDYPCTPKSWNISDDLGQIEYIFSDKTGTLTQNQMEFKKCTINGHPYGEAYTEALAGMQKRQGINVDEEGPKARAQIAHDRITMLEMLRRVHDNPYLRDEDLTFVAPNFVADLGGENGPEQKEACENFFLALALCHSVITERTPGDPPKIEFKAQSPDEAALVATARDLGFTVLGRSSDGIILNVLGEEREYTILNTLEFNSSRKRMSAIVRMQDGRIVLFCKGADSVIYSRLKPREQAKLRQTTAEHLEMFAREGLRTLCIAQRELTEEEYRKWNAEHDIAAAAVQDREEKLDIVSDAIERDLTLIGGTAIEDKLQDGVPDAIQLLAQGGIKLWVLTGDKVETAINIGFSCNLLGNDMDLIILKVEDENMDEAESQLDKHLLDFGLTGSDEELKAARLNHEAPAPTHALVIDGETLKLMLDEKLRQKFLLLCKECKSVLCCRVSPAQKAAVVSLVKHGLDVMTLAIGDGANDVAMIQEAHVGVGIAGVEGRQAVMSSDYAFGQFRYLTRLVLVHGRWSYRRLGETIANFFYKNLVWVFALFWYQIYTDFDCSYIFNYSYILLYNLAFTSLPVILLGILDQDVDDKVSLAVPQLYRRGIERKEWTQTKFWIYMFDGLYQSLICFFFIYALFEPATFISDDGRNVNDYQRIGVFIMSPTVVIVNTFILLNTYRWDWLMVLITTISMILVFFWTGVYAAFTVGFTFYESAGQVYGQLSFWCSFFLIVVLALLPRFVGRSLQKIYFPLDVDIIREQVRQGKFDYLKDVNPDHVKPIPEKDFDSGSSSDFSKVAHKGRVSEIAEDMRPIYPPSIAQTATTHNARSHNGSDGTDYTGHRASLDRAFGSPIPSNYAATASASNQQTSPTTNLPTSIPTIVNSGSEQAPWGGSMERPRPSFERVRPSYERPRPSFERVRSSMDRTRPSFEASRDFTSAAYLTRVESTASSVYSNTAATAMGGPPRLTPVPTNVTTSRRNDISDELRSGN